VTVSDTLDEWPALGQPVYLRPLLRMGSGPKAWAYLDTLARSARVSRDTLKPKLEALEQEGFVASTKAPAGLRYQLTEDGRGFTARSAPA
jgi:DNA-binding HxlR family transcriptional regulator